MEVKSKKKTDKKNAILDLNKLESVYLKIYKRVIDLPKDKFELKLEKAKEENDKRDWKFNNSIKNLLHYKLIKNKYYVKLKLKTFQSVRKLQT